VALDGVASLAEQLLPKTTGEARRSMAELIARVNALRSAEARFLGDGANASDETPVASLSGNGAAGVLLRENETEHPAASKQPAAVN